MAVLGSEFEEFRRTAGVEDVTLAFDSQDVQVVLDIHGLVKGISVFRPHDVVLGEVSLLGKRMADVSKDLQRSGVQTEIVDSGVLCEKIGVLLVDIEGEVDGVELCQAC